MIYFTFNETIVAIFFFFILGTFCGGISSSYKKTFGLFFKLILLPISISKNYTVSNKKGFKLKQKKERTFFNNFIDFLFVLTFGVIFIIFSYVFLDGAFRFFSVLFFVFGYIISKRFISNIVLYITSIISKIVYYIFFYFFSILLYPVFFICRLIKKLLKPIISTIIIRLEKLKKRRIIAKKAIAAENFLLKFRNG